jgi:hypothetical protein
MMSDCKVDLQNEIEQAVFNPTRKFFVHLFVVVLLVLVLVYIGLAVHTPRYLTDEKMRLAYLKSMGMVMPLVLGEVALTYFFSFKYMTKQRRKIIPWLVETVQSQGSLLEVVTVKKVSKLDYLLCRRGIRRAIKENGCRVRVECCVQTNHEFRGVLIKIPVQVKGWFLYPRYVALPLHVLPGANYAR